MDDIIEAESFHANGHTPGTWSVGQEGVPVGSPYVNVVAKMYRKAINADHVIATIRRGSDQWEANANLIAAAPELFRLLRECSTALADLLADADPTGLECQEQWACVAESKAAIAKAEGRSE